MFRNELLVSFLFVAFLVNSQDYCKLSCKRRNKWIKNTVCNRKTYNCSAGKRCVRNFQSININPKIKQYIVDEHNSYRNKIALGKTTRPKARNMLKLTWNDDLAYVAQCWTNACIYKHDKCRRTTSYYTVGQNLGQFEDYKGASSINYKLRLGNIMDAWFDQHHKMPEVQNLTKEGAGPDVKFYVQMLWANTKQIGCGLTHYATKISKSKKFFLFYCNYGPSGVLTRDVIYKIGEPASQCPRGTEPDKQFPGLCS